MKAPGTDQTASRHPLTWRSHMPDVELFGPIPGGHHLINFLYHIINPVPLLLVLRSWKYSGKEGF